MSVKTSLGTVYPTPTGLKIGSKGRVQRPNVLCSQLTKSERRALRKRLREEGFAKLAVLSCA